MVHHRRPTSTATVSLCIVARNDGWTIGDTITGAWPVVDDAVVLDTGSTDDTAQVARRAGARIVHATRFGGLARDHDLPMVHARGAWVLVLDGDEILDPATRHRIRELVETSAHEAYVLPVREYRHDWRAPRWRATDPTNALARGAAGYTPRRQVRLFRHRPGHRLTQTLHQTIAPQIPAGGTIADGDVTIHRYGGLRPAGARSHGHRGNPVLDLDRCRATVDERPDEARGWIDLGVVLLEATRVSAAAAAFRRAVGLGDHRGGAAFGLGVARNDLGRSDAAIPLLTAALDANSDDESPWFDRADAWEQVGMALDHLGRTRQAASAYRQAVRSRPDSPVAILGLAWLYTRAGQGPRAEWLLDRLIPDYRGSDLVWSALGAARLVGGDRAGAADAFDTALSIRPSSLEARFNRARLHARSGARQQAADDEAAVAERCDSFEARQLGISDRVVRDEPSGRSAVVTGPLGAGGVISTIGVLAGGAGRALVDAVLALVDRPQLVVCFDAGSATGQGLREELESAGVPVVVVGSTTALKELLDRARPAVVVHHWAGDTVVDAVVRVGGERWVCIGHRPLAMPFGYDAYVTHSSFHREMQGHLPERRVVDIPEGVDLSRFPAPAQGPRPVTIAMLARLEPGWFPRRLLHHLPLLDGARVWIAGWGPRRHEIEPDVEGRGLRGHVRFVGSIHTSQVPSFLGRADIGLHLTETHREEGSTSILEMMAARLPIVAEPRGCVPEMIEHDHDGLLASTEAGIAGHLHTLIRNPDLRRQMGQASRRAVGRHDLQGHRRSMQRLVSDVEAGRFDERPRALRHGPVPLRSDVTPRRSVLVLSTPRSGSTLLCDLLRRTGLAGTPQEYFAPSKRATKMGEFDVAGLDAYLQALFLRTTTPNGVFGTKLFVEHLEWLLERIGAWGTRPGSPLSRLADILPHPGYVRLSRRDKLRQAVSHDRAMQTGRWTGGPRPPALPSPPPHYDHRAIERWLRRLDRAEARLEQLLASSGIQPVRVVYEDLVDDPQRTVRQVLAKLDINAPDDLCPASTQMVRQADELSERWVARFRGGPQPGDAGTR